MASIREGSEILDATFFRAGRIVLGWSVRRSLKVIGIASFGLLAAWSLVLCIGILSRVAGAAGVGVGLAVFPLTFAGAPWYALLAQGDPTLLLIEYAGLPAAFVLYGIAQVPAHRAGAPTGEPAGGGSARG